MGPIEVMSLKAYLETNAVIGKPFLANQSTKIANDNNWYEFLKVDSTTYVQRLVFSNYYALEQLIAHADTDVYYIEEYDYLTDLDTETDNQNCINKICVCDAQDLFKGGCTCGAIKPYEVTYE